jgi:hypothetical protein
MKAKNFTIKENNKIKILESKEYNYFFDKETGFMAQWGKTQEEDPERAPGPVLADIEVVASCKGPGGKVCPFCYKGNLPGNNYMSFETYKEVFKRLPKSLTQIAFGADADLSVNPDIFKIMKYTRENGIIPNITVADINKEIAEKLAKVCGAVAVSWYGMHTSKDHCYNSIKYLTDAGMNQVNMHFMLSEETLPYINELINDIKNDERLAKLNAVVFLSLKQKGRGVKFKGCSINDFKEVIKKMMENNIPFGFDSCSAIKFLIAIKELYPDKYKEYKEMTEPCESFAQSIYINEKAEVFPCSFMENEYWNDGEQMKWNILEFKNDEEVLEQIWNSKEAKTFFFNSKKCQSCGQGCQYYQV